MMTVPCHGFESKGIVHGRLFRNAAGEEARHQAGYDHPRHRRAEGLRVAPRPAAARRPIVAKTKPGGAEMVHLFVPSLAALDKQLPQARRAMTTDGAIWVSWYKKAAKIETDVTEDAIRARALKTDLVDVKVCAVTDIWSGLKLVVRKHLR